jgi:Protein of unknown function (DUF2975)
MTDGFIAKPFPRVAGICRWASLGARSVAFVLFASSVAIWMTPGFVDIALNQAVPFHDGPTTLTFGVQMFCAVITALFMGLICWALWTAANLFDRIGRGEVFTLQTGTDLRLIGVCIAAFAAGTTLYRTLIILAVTAGNPSGQRMLSVSFESQQAVLFVFGLLILVLGHVMAEAARLADDNRQIV